MVALLGFLLAPKRHLACDETWLKERSPDHAWTRRVCRRPLMFAMPGGGSDAPGWMVLRDADPDRVVLSGFAEMPLVPAASPVSHWFAGRLWRVRAIVGLVPSDLISAR